MPARKPTPKLVQFATLPGDGIGPTPDLLALDSRGQLWQARWIDLDTGLELAWIKIAWPYDADTLSPRKRAR